MYIMMVHEKQLRVHSIQLLEDLQMIVIPEISIFAKGAIQFTGPINGVKELDKAVDTAISKSLNKRSSKFKRVR